MIELLIPFVFLSVWVGWLICVVENLKIRVKKLERETGGENG